MGVCGHFPHKRAYDASGSAHNCRVRIAHWRHSFLPPSIASTTTATTSKGVASTATATYTHIETHGKTATSVFARSSQSQGAKFIGE